MTRFSSALSITRAMAISPRKLLSNRSCIVGTAVIIMILSSGSEADALPKLTCEDSGVCWVRLAIPPAL
jgi:hypothetical protein